MAGGNRPVGFGIVAPKAVSHAPFKNRELQVAGRQAHQVESALLLDGLHDHQG